MCLNETGETVQCRPLHGGKVGTLWGWSEVGHVRV